MPYIATEKPARYHIAKLLTSTPTILLEKEFKGQLGSEYIRILNSNIRAIPPTEHEIAFLRKQVKIISNGFHDPRALIAYLAALLYCRPEQLPHIFELTAIPEWLINDFLCLIIAYPGVFQQIGETDNYLHFMANWINYIHENINKNPGSDFWINIARIFTRNSNLLPLVFTDFNLRSICSKWADIHEFSLRSLGASLTHDFTHRNKGRQKIRLGILTKHFAAKPESFACIPIFEHIDRNHFEVILFIKHANQNPIEQYATSCADSTVHLPDNYAAIVNAIRKKDLDILLVCTNITMIANPLTLACIHKLARVQAVHFNSPITTGIKNIDYYISGMQTEPSPQSQTNYSEKLVCLDGPGFCFSHAVEPYIARIKIDRSLQEIPCDAVVFISAANYFKLIPEVTDTWVRILKITPGSFLVLMPFSPTWSRDYPAETFMQSINILFDNYGINKKRLRILGSLPNRKDLQEALKIGDIYLDSFPYSGTTSLLDPLECGLPVVTMEGRTLRGRMGAAMLKSLALDEFIAANTNEYIETATRLAHQPLLRNTCKKHILEKMSGNPSFLDSHQYSRDIGILLKELFQDWQTHHNTTQI